MNLPFQIPLIHSRSPQVHSPPRTQPHRSAPSSPVICSPVLVHDPSLNLSRGSARGRSPLIVDASNDEEDVEEIIDTELDQERSMEDDEFEVVGNSVEQIDDDEDFDCVEPDELTTGSSLPPSVTSPPPTPPNNLTNHNFPSNIVSTPPHRPPYSRQVPNYREATSPTSSSSSTSSTTSRVTTPVAANSRGIPRETPRESTPRGVHANTTPVVTPRATTPRIRTVHNIPPLDLQSIDSEPIKKRTPPQQSPQNLTQHAYQNMPQNSKTDPFNWY